MVMGFYFRIVKRYDLWEEFDNYWIGKKNYISSRTDQAWNYIIMTIWHTKQIDVDSLRQKKIKTVIEREVVHASLVSTTIVSHVVEDG